MFFDSIPMTDKARSVVTDSSLTAVQCGDSNVSTEHLLLTLAADDATVARILLDQVDITHASINDALQMYRSERGMLGVSGEMQFGGFEHDPALKKAIDLAWNEATYFDGPRGQVGVVATEHLLIGLSLEPTSFAGWYLAHKGADYVNLRRSLRKLDVDEVALA